MSPEEAEDRAADRRFRLAALTVSLGVILGIYAAGTWYSSRSFERAMATIVARRGPCAGCQQRARARAVRAELTEPDKGVTDVRHDQ